jgi:hypothetical protein
LLIAATELRVKVSWQFHFESIGTSVDSMVSACTKLRVATPMAWQGLTLMPVMVYH